MKQVILIGLLLLCVQAGMLAQAPSKFYCKYGGDGVDIGYGVREIYQRQYVVIGSTSSYGAGGTDAYLMLIDSMGHLKWQQTFGGTGADVGKNVLFNPKDSGFVFAGFTSSFGNGGYDVFVVRTDKRGNKIWQATAGGEDWDFGNDISFGSDGNLVVCGFSHNRRFGKTDGVLVRLDIENGHILKERIFGGADQDEFNVIKMTSEGLLTVVGNTKSYLDSNGDFWMMKVNSNLDSLDTKFLGAANRAEKCYDFVEDRNNSLVICGSCDTSVAKVSRLESYAIKTNLSGLKTDEIYIPNGKSDQDLAWSVAVSKYNYTYFFSRRYYFGAFGFDIQPVLIDYNFIPFTATSYGELGTDEGYKIVSTIDTGFVVVGSTNGYGAISEDVCLAKTKENSIILPGNQVISGEVNQEVNQVNSLYYNDFAVFSKNKELLDFGFQVYALSGELITKGFSVHDRVDLSALGTGIYIIRLIENPKVFLKFNINK